jgi:hypothetical protein
MAFSTACSKSVLERCRAWLLLLFFLPVFGWAADIEVRDQRLTAGDDAYVLAADFRFELNPRLEEAVNRGVVLYFVAEFELARERWYWFDQKLVSKQLTYRLSYHALTRQYRLSTGGLHQSFATLGEALVMLRRLRNWQVIERNDPVAVPGSTYQAALRLRLDIAQLPRPFQISALGSKDWNLESDWKIWSATLPPPPAPAPVPEDK